MRLAWRAVPITGLAAALTLGATVSVGAAPGSSPSFHAMGTTKAAHSRSGGGSTNLSYHGGTAGIGVETQPALYIVYWGSQWIGNDPSGEAAYQQAFFNGVGGGSWNNTVTQYCQSVATGTTNCAGVSGAVFGGNPAGVLKGFWYDNASAAPSSPTQSQLAAEAVRAAGHFGNTAAGSNDTTQYVVSTATHNNMRGFGTKWCAWHSSTSSSYGNIAYTNFPYITDAGANCGQNFVNAGSAGLLDGVSIVGGHEFAETETDQYPNGGWLDSNGSEIGDKCAWISSGQGASTDITLATGTFAVQSLWSNAFNGNAGGCVTSF